MTRAGHLDGCVRRQTEVAVRLSAAGLISTCISSARVVPGLPLAIGATTQSLAELDPQLCRPWHRCDIARPASRCDEAPAMAAVAEVVQHQQHEVVLGEQPRLLYELLVAPVQLVFVVGGVHDHVADSAGD